MLYKAMYFYGCLCCQVLAKKTPTDQLWPLVLTTLAQLSDPHSSASSGVCVILNGLVKSRGAELHEQVSLTSWT